MSLFTIFDLNRIEQLFEKSHTSYGKLETVASMYFPPLQKNVCSLQNQSGKAFQSEDKQTVLGRYSLCKGMCTINSTLLQNIGFESFTLQIREPFTIWSYFHPQPSLHYTKIQLPRGEFEIRAFLKDDAVLLKQVDTGDFDSFFTRFILTKKYQNVVVNPKPHVIKNGEVRNVFYRPTSVFQ